MKKEKERIEYIFDEVERSYKVLQSEIDLLFKDDIKSLKEWKEQELKKLKECEAKK